jgi:hypothetical protein
VKFLGRAYPVVSLHVKVVVQFGSACGQVPRAGGVLGFLRFVQAFTEDVNLQGIGNMHAALRCWPVLSGIYRIAPQAWAV